MQYIFSTFFLLAALWVDHAALALILGVVFSLLFNPSQDFITKRIGSILLQIGIVILGGSISISSVVDTTSHYFIWISLFVLVTFLLGIYLGKLLGVNNKVSYLLASGTAICGGTAMAAIAPILKVKSEDLTLVMTIVFLLNAIAVIIFPIVGIYLGLTETQFGGWSALAIHDTASVLGSASILGDKALEVAATLKLGRTLWIVPLVIFSAWYFKEKRINSGLPLFVVFFGCAVLLNFFLSPSEGISNFLKYATKLFLLSGLFCIGTQSSRLILKNIFSKPLFLSLTLWGLVIPASLLVITSI
tara:strand:- start:287 stop:1195 length:909 start_codon:yes stop_codon:yes gene_type:complete